MRSAFEIRMRGLKKAYGDRCVLDIGDLALSSDVAYSLIGPNGSGKSTLLKVLSGVIAQSEGSIEARDGAGGECGSSLAVGYMPQKSYVFGFSVFENVALALKGSSIPADEVRQRVLAALEDVGMSEFVQERGGGLSGGEAQRVALARMLVGDWDALLLDEPTASMDLTGTLLVEEALARYRQRTGCMFVVATHVPAQARRISEQAVMLSEGHVVEHGSTDDVLLSPASDAGRSFLSYWSV